MTQNRFIPSGERLEIILASLEMMEATLLGMKQVRQYLGKGFATEMLGALIQEAELQIAVAKRRVVS